MTDVEAAIQEVFQAPHIQVRERLKFFFFSLLKFLRGLVEAITKMI